MHGQRAITADTALRLGGYFGMDPQFWLNLQTRYELEFAHDRVADQVAAIAPLADRVTDVARVVDKTRQGFDERLRGA